MGGFASNWFASCLSSILSIEYFSASYNQHFKYTSEGAWLSRTEVKVSHQLNLGLIRQTPSYHNNAPRSHVQHFRHSILQLVTRPSFEDYRASFALQTSMEGKFAFEILHHRRLSPSENRRQNLGPRPIGCIEHIARKGGTSATHASCCVVSKART